MQAVRSKAPMRANAASAGSKTPQAELARQIASAFSDLRNMTDLRTDVYQIKVLSVREVPIEHGRRAIVIYVPVPALKTLHKIHQRLTRELEKKFSDSHVVFLPFLRVQQKDSRSSQLKQKRPISRTATMVRERTIEHLVFPSDIVAKRTTCRMDGSRITHVTLDKKDATLLEHKLDTFAAVCKALSSVDIRFEFESNDQKKI